MLHKKGEIINKRNIIVIGTSAGGVEALSYLVHHLPLDLDAALMVVLHVPSHATSVLPRILNRAETLLALHPKNNEEIVTGRIYIAPPDYHLLVKPGYITLMRGPRENNHRPAIDPLFRSAARAYGSRVIGVVLTGVLDDGTAGLQAVKMRDGMAIVQSPDDAIYPGMPRSAIENVNDIDYILPLSKIPQVLVELVNTPVEGKAEKPVSHQMEIETDLADMNIEILSKDDRAGKPSTFGCPDCGGTLWELEQANLLRFRCRIGHAYSLESLLAKQSDALEDALWFALRALEEKASLTKRMAKRMRERNQLLAAERLQEQAEDALARANVIRETLIIGNANTEEKPV